MFYLVILLTGQGTGDSKGWSGRSCPETTLRTAQNEIFDKKLPVFRSPTANELCREASGLYMYPIFTTLQTHDMLY